MSILRPTIEKDGQKYVDEPVYVMPKTDGRDRVREAVEEAFGGPGFQMRKPIVVRHDRVYLSWMKPDGKGGLEPR